MGGLEMGSPIYVSSFSAMFTKRVGWWSASIALFGGLCLYNSDHEHTDSTQRSGHNRQEVPTDSPVTAAKTSVAEPQASAPDVVAKVAPAQGLLEVGSEGYAPFIQAALQTGGKAAVEAANIIGRCRDIDKHVESVYGLAQDPRMTNKNKGYVATVEYVQLEQRRCQTVTSELLQRRGELLLKATAMGEFGAAALYVGEMKGRIPAESKQVVTPQLRADAERGHAGALAILSAGNEEYSGSADDRKVYKAAYKRVSKISPDGISPSVEAVMRVLDKDRVLSFGDIDFFKNDSLNADASRRVDAIVEAHRNLVANEPR
ncbi:MAG: hypothetical protein ACT6S0_13600 [Roseateles sp.]|uniref:hypothetical protein n=1 Tax=Roseateles sp. TaxID=1971397 RepID=UPI0040374B59